VPHRIVIIAGRVLLSASGTCGFGGNPMHVDCGRNGTRRTPHQNSRSEVMRTLQVIAVMLSIGPFTSAYALSSGYDGSSNCFRTAIVNISAPGLLTAGSKAASTDRAIIAEYGCPPGFVPVNYHCVPKWRETHPASTPSAEQLPSPVQRNAFECSQRGLLPGGDAGVANGNTCLCPPPFHSVPGRSPLVSSRNECDR
jgi:hypothetical protein